MKEKRFLRLIGNVIIFSIITLIGFTSFVDFRANTATITPVIGGDGNTNTVSIAFRVIGGEEIDKTLEILEKNDVIATFFVGGKWAFENEENLIKIANKNHEIGNHGYLNRDFSALNYKEAKEDLKTCERVIENICGYKTVLFMPPRGKYNNSTMVACDELGYKMVLSTKRAISDDSGEVKSISISVNAGDIILLSPNEGTLEVLDEIIKGIKSRGFKIKSVGANIA